MKPLVLETRKVDGKLVVVGRSYAYKQLSRGESTSRSKLSLWQRCRRAIARLREVAI